MGLFHPFVWPAILTVPTLIFLPMMVLDAVGQWKWFSVGMMFPWAYLLITPFRRHRNDEAIEHFQRQLVFLNRHPWFDIVGALLAFWPTCLPMSLQCWSMIVVCHVREKRIDDARAITGEHLSLFGPLDLSPAALSVMGLSRADIAEVRSLIASSRLVGSAAS